MRRRERSEAIQGSISDDRRFVHASLASIYLDCALDLGLLRFARNDAPSNDTGEADEVNAPRQAAHGSEVRLT